MQDRVFPDCDTAFIHGTFEWRRSLGTGKPRGGFGTFTSPCWASNSDPSRSCGSFPTPGSPRQSPGRPTRTRRDPVSSERHTNYAQITSCFIYLWTCWHYKTLLAGLGLTSDPGEGGTDPRAPSTPTPCQPAAAPQQRASHPPVEHRTHQSFPASPVPLCRRAAGMVECPPIPGPRGVVGACHTPWHGGEGSAGWGVYVPGHR